MLQTKPLVVVPFAYTWHALYVFYWQTPRRRVCFRLRFGFHSTRELHKKGGRCLGPSNDVCHKQNDDKTGRYSGFFALSLTKISCLQFGLAVCSRLSTCLSCSTSTAISCRPSSGTFCLRIVLRPMCTGLVTSDDHMFWMCGIEISVICKNYDNVMRIYIVQIRVTEYETQLQWTRKRPLRSLKN